jgi:hypothetical protein
MSSARETKQSSARGLGQAAGSAAALAPKQRRDVGLQDAHLTTPMGE